MRYSLNIFLLISVFVFILFLFPRQTFAYREGVPHLILSDPSTSTKVEDEGTLTITHGLQMNYSAVWDSTELSNMDPNHQYTYRVWIVRINNGTRQNIGELQVGIKNNSCNNVSYTSGDMWLNTNYKGCDQSFTSSGALNSISFNNAIDTNKLPADSTYNVTIESGNPSTTYHVIEINWKTDPVTIKLDQGHGDTYYEGLPITVTVTGCPTGQPVGFTWWTDPNNQQTRDPIISDANKQVSFSRVFDWGDNTIRYTCLGIGNTKVFHVTAVHGNESVTINDGNPISENVSFPIKFDNITPGQCYWFYIKGKDTNFIPQDRTSAIECTGGTIDINGDSSWQPNLAYASSDKWSPTGTTNIGPSMNFRDKTTSDGLPAANYTLELWYIKDKTLYQVEHGPFPFCVGTQCQIDSGSLPTLKPPDKPPCANTIDESTQGCSKIDTALGTISTDPASFIKFLFTLLLSLSGGIALLLIIRSGYQLMVSQGNAEKIKEAREILTSAIVGLVFIIFSLVILQIIGVDILKLPGFSGA